MFANHSHSFDIGIARNLGVNAAIVFNHIIYWLRINASKGTNIHDGRVWMYESQKEIAEFLEYLTLEEVKKAIVKLLEAGLLIKGNYNSNRFDRTSWYTTADENIIKIKKTLTKAPYGAIDNATGRDPQRPMAPCIIQEEHIQKEQQQQQGKAAPPTAAAFSDEPKEKMKPPIYESLAKIDIPQADKLEITNRYGEADVKHAISWALHPKTKLHKGLAPALKWACANKPAIPSDDTYDQVEENKAYAGKYNGKSNGCYTINVLSKCVEIDYGTAYKEPFTLEYTAKAFKEKFENVLKKLNFQVIQTA